MAWEIAMRNIPGPVISKRNNYNKYVSKTYRWLTGYKHWVERYVKFTSYNIDRPEDDKCGGHRANGIE